MKMKKIISIVLSLLIVVSVVGCGKKEGEKSEKTN